VIGAQLLLSDGQGALHERLRFRILPLGSVERCQIVEAGGRVGVIVAQLLLINGQGALEERLGLLVLPLVALEVG
jgi:hypothetical protein